MTWFKVDDKLHSHNKIRKVLAEAPAALALWTVAGSWSADNLTDGFIPDHQLPWLIPAGAEELASKLVAARLWRRVRGGYQFHQWDADGDGSRRNPTRAEVEELRRKKAEAGRKGGLSSANTRSKKQARASAGASADAKGLLEPPTRPPPSTKEDGGGARADAGRGAAPGTAAALAIAACQLCDERGYRNGLVCDHDPTLPDRTRRGAAKVRAALRRTA